jgi:hypothetical protein
MQPANPWAEIPRDAQHSAACRQMVNSRLIPDQNRLPGLHHRPRLGQTSPPRGKRR